MNSPESDDSRPASLSIWMLALLVTTAAAAFGVYQAYVFFDQSFPEFYWSRTIAAFASVAIAGGGPAIPLLLIVRRAAFMRFSRTAQSAALILLPLCYIAAFGLLLDVARGSHPMYSTTQTMTLRHATEEKSPGDYPSLDLDVPGGMSGLGRGHGGGDGEWVAEWEYWWLPSHLRESGDESDLQLACSASMDADGSWELKVDVETDRTLIFDVDGFTEAQASRDGATVSLPLELEQGFHTLIVSARPR